MEEAKSEAVGVPAPVTSRPDNTVDDSRPPRSRLSGSRLLAWTLRLIQAGPLVVLLVLGVVMTILSPFFLTESNLQNLGLQTSIIAALALGQLLVIVTRGIDISVGSVVALSGVVGAMVAEQSWGSGLPVIVAILLTGAAVGTVNAILIVKGRIPQPLIVTLATLGIARGLALVFSDGQTQTGLPDAVVTAGSGFVGPIPVPVLIVLGVAAVLVFLTKKTQWGRWLYAVGGDSESARRLGIPADRILMAAFIICGLTAGLAGLLTAGRTDSGSPLAGQLLELDAITAVIIGGASLFGGRGSVVNAVIGALILGVIRNGLNLLDVEPFWQGIAIGGVVLLSLELDVVRRALEEKLRVLQARGLT